jgi:excisionase family DNA binding protein
MSRLPAPRMYTVDEFADVVRVTRRTVYRWIVAGRLPSAVKVSHQWLVSERVVDSILAGRGGLSAPKPRPRSAASKPKAKPEVKAEVVSEVKPEVVSEDSPAARAKSPARPPSKKVRRR